MLREIEPKRTTKHYSIHFIQSICLFATIYFVCSFLMQDNALPISINSFWDSLSNRTQHNCHILAVALLPIYVAIVVFGAAYFMTLLGSILKRCARWFKLFS